MADLDIIRRAREFAQRYHGAQQYSDHPYVFHLDMVRKVLADHGHDNPEMHAAALLHDVIEDTAANYNDVREQFGHTVAELVYAVTDELGRNRAERHHKTLPKIKAMPGAVTLKLADRIANVQHSINTKDWRRFNLYRAEQEEFRAALWNSFGPVPMWALLHQLLEQDF